MANVSESPVPDAMRGSLRKCAQSVLPVLRLKADAPVVIETIDAFVFSWQKGKRPDPKTLAPDDAPYILGSLWGDQLVARFGWEWALVTFHDHGDTYAPGVLSPDRSLAIYPIHFLMGCLPNPRVDCTIALAFNMLESGNIEPLQRGGYVNLMEQIHRIVPRD